MKIKSIRYFNEDHGDYLKLKKFFENEILKLKNSKDFTSDEKIMKIVLIMNFLYNKETKNNFFKENIKFIEKTIEENLKFLKDPFTFYRFIMGLNSDFINQNSEDYKYIVKCTFECFPIHFKNLHYYQIMNVIFIFCLFFIY